MIGPKLDARSYAILILAAITVLLGTRLIAQETGGAGADFRGSAEVASATREVASATREVAAANVQIAEAIRQLADSVKDLKSALKANEGSDSSAAISAAPSASGSEPAPLNTDAKEDTDKGVFEFGSKKK